MTRSSFYLSVCLSVSVSVSVCLSLCLCLCLSLSLHPLRTYNGNNNRRITSVPIIKIIVTAIPTDHTLCLNIKATPQRLRVPLNLRRCREGLLFEHRHRFKDNPGVRAQELCESRGGRPGVPSLISQRFLWT